MVRSLLEKGQVAIASTGWTFFITDGFRSFAEQTELYAQGRTKGIKGAILTNAKAGESAHNYGLAVDMAFQKNGVLSYDVSLYAKVYPIARTLGFVLGADWTPFVDKPHFEYPNWRNISSEPVPSEPKKDTMTKEKFYDKFLEAFKKHRDTIDWGDDKHKFEQLGLSDEAMIGRMIDEIARSKKQREVDYAIQLTDATKKAYDNGKNSVPKATEQPQSSTDPNPNPSKLELNGAQVVVGPVTFNYKTK